MSLRTITIGAAMLALAGPAAAQQRGTVEFGAFGSAGMFDKSLTLDKALGGGGHVGVFLDPRIAVEFEMGEMRATRTLGLKDVNVGILSARLVGTAIEAGNLSILLGAGAGTSTETNFLHSYGVNGLVGAKFRINDNAAIRIDAIADFLANNDWKSYQTLHVGLSLFRSPNNVTKVVEVEGKPVPYVQRPDSVSAEEQARRREEARKYRELRDSLSRRPVATPSSAAALATMEEKIHFVTDKSDLSPEAKETLDAKVAVFKANPAMRIVILGNTDERASDAYNMGLGRRRAVAAKEYLVSKGVDPVRIEITSEGERMPTAAGTSTTAQGLNRRDEFRLLIASDYLVPAKP
ncbi:MAG: OmpA family protein [Proteobacteria bacterium]|nr:OmpA family protein [Pseudomonadota bacterium]